MCGCGLINTHTHNIIPIKSYRPSKPHTHNQQNTHKLNTQIAPAGPPTAAESRRRRPRGHSPPPRPPCCVCVCFGFLGVGWGKSGRFLRWVSPEVCGGKGSDERGVVCCRQFIIYSYRQSINEPSLITTNARAAERSINTHDIARRSQLQTHTRTAGTALRQAPASWGCAAPDPPPPPPRCRRSPLCMYMCGVHKPAASISQSRIYIHTQCDVPPCASISTLLLLLSLAPAAATIDRRTAGASSTKSSSCRCCRPMLDWLVTLFLDLGGGVSQSDVSRGMGWMHGRSNASGRFKTMSVVALGKRS